MRITRKEESVGRPSKHSMRLCSYDCGIPVVGIVLTLILASLLIGCVAGKLSTVPPSAAAGIGVYEIQVGNSLYPKSRGASIGFQRYLDSGEDVTGSVEWRESHAIRYKWSLYVYDPKGNIALEWNGADLKHQFHFTATKAGTYRLEILKRDFDRRGAQLIIDPPDWNRWGG